ncbi:MAG: hypothetical protein IPI65_09795 [Bacteroidetes bacterium]|nr:hypothetical protein [Bacteroidota bacterium]
MFKYLQILFLGLSLMFGNTAFCQTGNDCARQDGIYKRKQTVDDFGRWQQYALTIVKTDSSFQLIIDTNATTKFLYKKVINDNLNLHVYQKRSNNDLYFNFFLIDELNQVTVCQTENDDYYLDVYYACGKIYIWKNNGLSILETNDKLLIPTIFTNCRIVGADSNSIFIKNFGTVNVDGRICYGEILFKISTKDVRCIVTQSSKKHQSRYNAELSKLVYLSTEYNINLIGITSGEVNCGYRSFYNYSITYNNEITDTLVIESELPLLGFNKVIGDTLVIETYQTTYSFLHGKKIAEICINDTLKNQLNHVIGEFIYFYTVDNYLLAAKNYRFETIDSLLYNAENGVTINKLNPVDEGLGLQIIYLFDKNTMEFLGYPEVVFR